MASFHGHFVPESLGMQTGLQIILPEHTQTTQPRRTLYLLHGRGDNETNWVRRTAIERYADTFGIAVIMPNADTSFYTDMAYGKNYWTYISEELPHIVNTHFKIETSPEHTYVAGLSMGGYGAFKLALNHPDRFRAAASFSGALDVRGLMSAVPEDQQDERERSLTSIFGHNPDLEAIGADLFSLVTKHQQAGRALPELYQYCGTDDFLYEMNSRFRDHLKNQGVDAYYEEEKADHTWDYWDYCIESFLGKICK
ncbi:alpha/beta hydrolase [Alkalihalobacillus sp. NPDC078783]